MMMMMMMMMIMMMMIKCLQSLPTYQTQDLNLGLSLESPEKKNLGLNHENPEKKVQEPQTLSLILPGAEDEVEEPCCKVLTPSAGEGEDSEETSWAEQDPCK